MFVRKPAVLAGVAALAIGLGACGGTEDETAAGGETAADATQTDQQQAEPVAQIDELAGQTTSVALDSGFLEALDSLEVTPGAVGDAEITEDGAAVFPITGGNVTYYEPGSVSPFVQGMIEHEGSGLSLEREGTTVELTDFTIDPGKSVLTGQVSVDGEVAAEEAPLFFLDGRTLEPLETNDDGTAVLQGTTVKLKEEAAQLLNDTFGVQDHEAGMEIGTATLTLEAAQQ